MYHGSLENIYYQKKKTTLGNTLKTHELDLLIKLD